MTTDDDPKLNEQLINIKRHEQAWFIGSRFRVPDTYLDQYCRSAAFLVALCCLTSASVHSYECVKDLSVSSSLAVRRSNWEESSLTFRSTGSQSHMAVSSWEQGRRWCQKRLCKKPGPRWSIYVYDSSLLAIAVDSCVCNLCYLDAFSLFSNIFNVRSFIFFQAFLLLEVLSVLRRAGLKSLTDEEVFLSAARHVEALTCMSGRFLTLSRKHP